MSKVPTKKGQAFDYNGKTYTVEAFHGSDGIFYNTLFEAKDKCRGDRFILVVPLETGGGIDVEKTIISKSN